MHIVTGGAGFIGSNLVAQLDQDSQDVVIVDTLGSDDRWRNIAKRRIRDLVCPSDLPAFLAGVGKVECVFHMGAISTTTETNVDAIVRQNFRASIDIWNWCASRKVPLVYASSAATYGDGNHGFDDQFTDDYLSALRPLNAYGWSKHVFDRWVLSAIHRSEPVPPRWAGLKFFNVYGPNEYHKGGQRSVAVQLFEQIQKTGCAKLFKSDSPDYADGAQTRDFVWVQDCVDVALWLSQHEGVRSDLYNVGSALPRTFADKARVLFDVLGLSPEIKFIDLPENLRGKYQYYTCANMSKLLEAGYDKPLTSLELGIGSFVRDYLTQSDIYR